MQHRLPFAFLLVAASMLAFGAAAHAQSGADAPPPRGDRPQGPPPEAFAACTSKAVDDACSFTGRNNDTVAGRCELPRTRPSDTGSASTSAATLACRPDRPPRDGAGPGP